MDIVQPILENHARVSRHSRHSHYHNTNWPSASSAIDCQVQLCEAAANGETAQLELLVDVIGVG